MPTLRLTLTLLAAAWLWGCSSTPTVENTTPARSVDASNRDKAVTRVDLAVTYMGLGNLEDALRFATQALALDDRLPSAHHTYALVQMYLGRIESAERHFNKAIDLDPRNSQQRNNYALLLCRLGRIDDSKEQFLKAVENPRYAQRANAYNNLAICLRRNDRVDEAIEYLELAVVSSDELPEPLLDLAQINFERGELERADDYLSRYERLTTHSAASLWLAIRLARARGDDNGATNYGFQLRGRFPNSREAQLLLRSEGR